MPLNTAALKSRQQLTYDIIEVTFETQGPFTFTAGQFVTFKVADKMPPCFRAYSISSIPKQNGNIFETCLKIIPNGRGSTWLNSLKIGDKVEFMGPNGNLAFRTQQGKTAIFIATGTDLVGWPAPAVPHTTGVAGVTAGFVQRIGQKSKLLSVNCPNQSPTR